MRDDETMHRRLRKSWHQRAREERAALRTRLEEVYPDVPECVRDDLWEWAWEKGHAGGFREVERHYQDVAWFLGKVVKELGK